MTLNPPPQKIQKTITCTIFIIILYDKFNIVVNANNTVIFADKGRRLKNSDVFTVILTDF